MVRTELLLAFTLLAGCGGGEEETAFSVFPLKAYSGFDESMSYVVPIGAEGATGIVWSCSDESVASVSGNDMLATVTAKKAGAAKIVATAGSETMMVDLMVVAYTAADREAGTMVYSNFDCGDCHGPTSDSDITSSGIAEHTDAEILAAIVDGAEPEGGQIELDTREHKFTLTEEQQRQIAAYLRGKPPQGAPKPD